MADAVVSDSQAKVQIGKDRRLRGPFVNAMKILMQVGVVILTEDEARW